MNPKLLVPACILFSVCAEQAVFARDLEFGRDVLPILSDACFHCHGPDEKARKAELRLDTREGAFRTKDGVTVVKPGDLENSELVVRITSLDPDEQMPPPKANRKLKPEEIEVLKKWVAGGAKWGTHWAFAPLKGNPARRLDPADAAGEIDKFVRQRLSEEALTPSPEAAKAVSCGA